MADGKAKGAAPAPEAPVARPSEDEMAGLENSIFSWFSAFVGGKASLLVEPVTMVEGGEYAQGVGTLAQGFRIRLSPIEA